jgi:hypothetical protein
MNNPPRKGGLKKINSSEAKVSPTGGDLEGAIISSKTVTIWLTAHYLEL